MPFEKKKELVHRCLNVMGVSNSKGNDQINIDKLTENFPSKK